MKPVYLATLIAAFLAILAKKQFVSLQGFFAQEAVTVQRKHDELQQAKDSVAAMLAADRQATGVAPVLDKYIGSWVNTLPIYSEMTAETKFLEQTYKMRLINNSLNPNHQEVKIGDIEYPVDLRTYEFGTDYSNALNCLGAFESKFELLHIRTLELVRKKDELQFSLLLELPLFDNVSI
jgi:hypothetical protein